MKVYLGEHKGPSVRYHCTVIYTVSVICSTQCRTYIILCIITFEKLHTVG